MDKNILKIVIADNKIEVPKYKVIPRDFTFEEFVIRSTFGNVWKEIYTFS